MDWLKQLAPALGTALLGPMGGIAAKMLADKIGLPEKTVEAVQAAIAGNSLSADQVASIKLAEIEFAKFCKQNEIDVFALEAKDRDSARRASVDGGTAKMLFWMSVLLILVTLGTEIAVLFLGYPSHIPEIIVGRVLGLMDAVAMMVLSFNYGTTHGSMAKTNIIAQSAPVR